MEAEDAGTQAALSDAGDPVEDARRPTKEEILDYLRSEGLLDEIKAELLESLPQQGFTETDEDMRDFLPGMGTGGFPWQYWKKVDGRVITGPTERETLYPIYVKKGFKPLPQYGKLPPPGAPVPCCKHKFMRNEQFHVLFARGGAGEMSLEQVVNAGWHVNPPTVHGKRIEFPQIEGRKIQHVECDECDRNIYGITKPALITALRQHAKAAHQFSRRDVDEMLYRIGFYSEPPRTRPQRQRAPAEA